MMENDFYFILQAAIVQRYLDFCPDFSGYVGKRLDKHAEVKFKIDDVTYWERNSFNRAFSR